MRFTYMVAGRTNKCLLFLLNKTHNNHSSSHHVSSCNSFFFRKCPFSSTPTATNPTSGDDDRAVDRSSSSPTISYLIQNCGLSTESAISASKKFKLKFPKKSDSVLRLLRDYGFTDKQITVVIIKCTRMLSVQADRNLKPKLEFLLSEGFTHIQIVDILSNNPLMLTTTSLERKIIPSLISLRTILPTNDAIFRFLKYTGHLSVPTLLINVKTLRSNGVSESVIRKICTKHPRTITRTPNCFAKAVEKSMDLGFEPSKVSMFVNAVFVLLSYKPSTWERRVMFCRSLGWSHEETLLMFKRQPLSFTLSNKLIKKKMDFFTQKLGCSPRRLVSYGNLFMFSLEKRIIPRCSVLSLLITKGLIRTISLYYLRIPEEKFLERFVEEYKDQVPEVMEAYNGKLTFKGLFPRWWK